MKLLYIYKPKRFFALMRADAKNIIRDPVLVYVSILAILPTFIIYFFGEKIANEFNFPTSVFNLAVPTILTFSAFLVGWISGFLILEERDDGPLIAVEITPIGKNGLMVYRLTLTFIMSAIITLLSIELLLPNMVWEMKIFYIILIGLEAMSMALIIPALANNKVEGLAVAKLVNIGALMPALALIPSAWRYLGAIFPTYWIGESFQFTPFQYLSQNIIILLAIISHIAVFLLLFLLFKKRIG